MKIDYVSKIIDCCRKREEVLLNDEPMGKYNRYFDQMRKYAHKLIDEDRQEELLPYLESDSISIQRDIAGLLFNSYPDKCREVLFRISKMSVQTGLPKHLIGVSVSAAMALDIGIPKDYP